MPYKSLAQERYFNANRAKLESQGVSVDEWNQASKGMSLPKRLGPPHGSHGSGPYGKPSLLKKPKL